MNTLEQYKELLTLCQYFVTTNTGSMVSNYLDTTTYEFFSKCASKYASKCASMNPILLAPTPQPPTPMKKPQMQPSPSQPQALPKAVSQPKPTPPPQLVTEAVPELPSPSPMPPVTSPPHSYLPRPLPAHMPPVFTSMKETIQKVAPHLSLHDTPPADALATEIASQWRQSYPQVILLSFLPSNAFIKNLHEGINTHLVQTALSYHPSIEDSLQLTLLARHHAIKAIILIQNNAVAHKVSDFMTNVLPYCSTTSSSTVLSPLQLRSTLYQTPIIDLCLTEPEKYEQKEKAALWKSLKQVLNSS